MAALLEELVLCESPSGDVASLARVLDLLSDAFAERRFRPRLLSGNESGGMLLAMPDDRPRHRPHQLLLGHCDTVWPIGTLETMPAKTEDGTFWGPGLLRHEGRASCKACLRSKPSRPRASTHCP